MVLPGNLDTIKVEKGIYIVGNPLQEKLVWIQPIGWCQLTQFAQRKCKFSACLNQIPSCSSLSFFLLSPVQPHFISLFISSKVVYMNPKHDLVGRLV